MPTLVLPAGSIMFFDDIRGDSQPLWSDSPDNPAAWGDENPATWAGVQQDGFGYNEMVQPGFMDANLPPVPQTIPGTSQPLEPTSIFVKANIQAWWGVDPPTVYESGHSFGFSLRHPNTHGHTDNEWLVTDPARGGTPHQLTDTELLGWPGTSTGHGAGNYVYDRWVAAGSPGDFLTWKDAYLLEQFRFGTMIRLQPGWSAPYAIPSRSFIAARVWIEVSYDLAAEGIDPPLRLYPHRGDGLGADNARRLHPPPASFQGGQRRGWRGGHL